MVAVGIVDSLKAMRKHTVVRVHDDELAFKQDLFGMLTTNWQTFTVIISLFLSLSLAFWLFIGGWAETHCGKKM